MCISKLYSLEYKLEGLPLETARSTFHIFHVACSISAVFYEICIVARSLELKKIIGIAKSSERFQETPESFEESHECFKKFNKNISPLRKKFQRATNK